MQRKGGKRRESKKKTLITEMQNEALSPFGTQPLGLNYVSLSSVAELYKQLTEAAVQSKFPPSIMIFTGKAHQTSCVNYYYVLVTLAGAPRQAALLICPDSFFRLETWSPLSNVN